MGQVAIFPAFPPAPAVMQILSRFNREQLHGFISIAIDLADAIDGDPDLEGEWNEDEISSVPSWVSLDDGPGCQIADAGGQRDEDGINTGGSAFWTHGVSHEGPGCPISDPGGTYGLDC